LGSQAPLHHHHHHEHHRQVQPPHQAPLPPLQAPLQVQMQVQVPDAGGQLSARHSALWGGHPQGLSM